MSDATFPVELGTGTYSQDLGPTYLDTMVESYIECALWSSLNWEYINATEGDEPTMYTGENLDADFGPEDITAEALASMREDCSAFLEGANDQKGASLLRGVEADQAGHDFWLTRNQHGAGFWDRGLGEQGDALTSLAHPFGDSDLYIGDDLQVHVS